MVKFLRSGGGFSLPVGSQDGDLLFVENGRIQRRAIGDNGQGLHAVSGLPNWADTLLSIPDLAEGDLFYRSSGGFARIGIGSTGQSLVVASGLPEWASPSTVSGDMQGTPIFVNSSGQTLTRNRYSVVTVDNATVVMPSVSTAGWFIVVNASATPITISATGTALDNKLIPAYGAGFIYTNESLTDYIGNFNVSTATTQTDIFTYTGADQVVAVPSWATVAEVKEWAAAGGGAFQSSVMGRGGAGAYAGFEITVTGGEDLLGMIGQGGYSSNTVAGLGRTYGGGGNPRSSSITVYNGAGGGFTALYRNTTLLGLAAGGGGGGLSAGNGGGAGGGLTGQDGFGSNFGIGGTQSLGGSFGGASLLGGNSNASLTNSAGGGSGFFGGGAATANGGAGAGGSSFIIGTATNPVMAAGSGFTPGNNADPHYIAGVGVGGLGTSNGLGTAIGGNGLLVITFRSV